MLIALHLGWTRVPISEPNHTGATCYACNCLHKAQAELAHCYYWASHYPDKLSAAGDLPKVRTKYTADASNTARNAERNATGLQNMQNSATPLVLGAFRRPTYCPVHPSAAMLALDHA